MRPESIDERRLRERNHDRFEHDYMGHIPPPHPLLQEKDKLLHLIKRYPENPLLRIKLSLLDSRIAYGIHCGRPPRAILENLALASIPEKELLITWIEKLVAKIEDLKKPPSDFPWWQQLWERMMRAVE